ncbi:MAG: ATP-binding cassette domain-containing protein, partial [Oscillospiraceae bacterium]|nr:ATP-binding cassette domain-containing protein [Oscillospiraceae bacterium]
YTGLQNVMMPLLIRGYSHRKAAQIAAERLEMLEMGNRLSHKPNELSGGQQQRVAIARALVGHPKLLLADEPTGALDSATGKEVLKLFEELNQNGHTIVMITHDLQVATHAKRIVKIIDGELFEEGETAKASSM